MNIDTLDDVEQLVASDRGLTALRAHVVPRLGDDPGHDIFHAMRVAFWTIRLGGSAIDAREAVAAALLHDVVNLPKDSPDRAKASEHSADYAAACLPEYGFAADAIERICEAVRDHSYSRGARPTALLAKVLQDADRLEALGALGIMRTISCGARMGAQYLHPTDPWASDRALDDRRYSIDHFFAKLLRLTTTMNTEAGRVEAERRTRYLVGFLAQLRSELGTSSQPKLPDLF